MPYWDNHNFCRSYKKDKPLAESTQMFGMGSSSMFAIPTALDELQDRNLQKDLAEFMPASLDPKEKLNLVQVAYVRYWITLVLEPHHMRFALNGLGIFRNLPFCTHKTTNQRKKKNSKTVLAVCKDILLVSPTRRLFPLFISYFCTSILTQFTYIS